METTIQLTDWDRERVEAFRARHKTGVLTLVFTDVVDSTGLKRDLGEITGNALVTMHQDVVRKQLGQFPEAEEITTAGDSFFLIFIRPSDAVRFALSLHAELRKLAEKIPRKILVRIGIHMGEVFIKRDCKTADIQDILGMQVDVAHRIMSLAGGNQTLVTSSVLDNARAVLRGEKLTGLQSVLWRNHGPYLIKGLEDPWDVCEVGEQGFAPLAPPSDSEKAQRYATLDIKPVKAVQQPEKQWTYLPVQSALAPILFFELGYDSIAVVFKEDCSCGRQMQSADIEIPIIDPKTRRRDRDKVEKISRCHFQIKLSNRQVYLVDTSSHGTYVNETRIQRLSNHLLKQNDRIQMIKESDSWAIEYSYREFILPQTGSLTAIRIQQMMNASPRAIIFLLQEATIGSSEDDIISFSMPGIKPGHARVLRHDNKLWIESLQGKVGVNGHSLDKNELWQIGNGCEINLASQIIKLNPQQTRFWKTLETAIVTQ
ncbi:MAG: FHA domain-containing protein [bacterium]